MRIKIFRIILFTFCIGFILISCGKSSKEVFRIDSLNDSCWQSSLWISVANAPVVKEKVYDGTVQQMVPVGSCLQLKMIRKLVVHCG